MEFVPLLPSPYSMDAGCVLRRSRTIHHKVGEESATPQLCRLISVCTRVRAMHALRCVCVCARACVWVCACVIRAYKALDLFWWMKKGEVRKGPTSDARALITPAPP